MTLRVPLVDEGGGRLTVHGARYVLVRPETLAALHRAIERAAGDTAGECLAAGGRAGGGTAVASLRGDDEARVRALLETAAAIGWGEFRLERLTADALAVTVRNSPFAEGYGRAERPVCHLIRGVLDSLAAAVLARTAPVVETRCAAAGAPD